MFRFAAKDTNLFGSENVSNNHSAFKHNSPPFFGELCLLTRSVKLTHINLEDVRVFQEAFTVDSHSQ
jgi:hypothetical protein